MQTMTVDTSLARNHSVHALTANPPPRERIDHFLPTPTSPTSPTSRSSLRLRKPSYSSISNTSRQNISSASPPASSFLALNQTPTSTSSPSSVRRNNRRRRSTSLAKPGPIEILSAGSKATNNASVSHFHHDSFITTPQWTSTGSIDANLFLLSSSAGKRRIDEELEADEVKDDEFNEEDDDDDDEDGEMLDDANNNSSGTPSNGNINGKFSSKKSNKKRGEVFRCEKCSKQYRHPQCLIKHRWQHTAYWNEASKLMLSKHQQVQMLEAAAILSNAGSLPEEKSLWPAAVSPPTSGLFGSDTLNTETIRRRMHNAKSVPTHPGGHMDRKGSSGLMKRESDEDSIAVDDDDDEDDRHYRRRDHSSADTSSSSNNNKGANTNGEHPGAAAISGNSNGDMEMDGDDMFSLDFEHGNDESSSSFNNRNNTITINSKYQQGNNNNSNNQPMPHPYLRSPPAGAHPYMLPASPPQVSFALGSNFPASAPVMGFFERRDSPRANNNPSNYSNNHNPNSNNPSAVSYGNDDTGTNNNHNNGDDGMVEVVEEFNQKVVTSGLRGEREQSVDMED